MFVIRRYKLKICDFTVPELNKFRELCNFTEQESKYFELKSKDMSNIQIATQMNVSESTVSKLARSVKSKIFRII